MEQETASKRDASPPPDRDMARQYLAHADALVKRRNRLVDRRAVARVRIMNAALVSLFLCVAALNARSDGPSLRWLAFLILALLWGPLSAGIIKRSDRGIRPPQWRGVVVGSGIFLVLFGVGTFLLILLDDRISPVWMLVPAAATLVGYGGYGVAELVSAPLVPKRSSLRPERMTTAARWGTMLIGLVVGAVILLGTTPADSTNAILTLLVILVTAAWTCAASSAVGLPAIGDSWRWPQFGAFFIAVLAVTAVTTLPADPSSSASVAGGVIALFAGVSMDRGRGRHE